MTNIKDNPVNLILDTHILIWYAEGIKLSKYQIELIEKAREHNMLYISAISIWEVAMLENKGKIVLSINLNDWINKLLSIPGLNLMDLSVSVLIESCFLPNYEHKDPADRFIIASTRNNNSYLFTYDQKIIEYANLGYLKKSNIKSLNRIKHSFKDHTGSYCIIVIITVFSFHTE